MKPNPGVLMYLAILCCVAVQIVRSEEASPGVSVSVSVPLPVPDPDIRVTTTSSSSYSTVNGNGNVRSMSDLDGDDDESSSYGETNQYEPPEDDDDNEEIDCSKFENLDYLPPSCRQDDNDGFSLPPEAATPTPTSDSSNGDSDWGSDGDGDLENDGYGESDGTNGNINDIILIDAQTIQVPMSVGLYQVDKLTESRAQTLVSLLIQVMSKLLDQYTPFDVIIPNSGRSSDETENGSNRGIRRILAESDDDGDDYVDTSISSSEEEFDQGFSLNALVGASGAQSGWASNSDNDVNNDGEDLLARLYFLSVAVWKAPLQPDWLQLSVVYSAYWPNGEPVMDRRNLDRIEVACIQLLNETIDFDKFMEELLKEDDDHEFVARKHRRWPRQLRDQSAIADISKFGEEFLIDFSVFESDAIEPNAPAGNPNLPASGRVYYTEPLILEWNVREWFGLGLVLLTLLVVTTLTLVSAHLQRQHKAQDLWGLTEHGVGELLNVGWAYHQQEEHDGCQKPAAPAKDQDAAANGQLFLQIFDKAKVGYSDDNSMLEGGVQHPFEGSTTQTYTGTTPETARTSTPPPSPST